MPRCASVSRAVPLWLVLVLTFLFPVPCNLFPNLVVAPPRCADFRFEAAGGPEKGAGAAGDAIRQTVSDVSRVRRH